VNDHLIRWQFVVLIFGRSIIVMAPVELDQLAKALLRLTTGMMPAPTSLAAPQPLPDQQLPQRLYAHLDPLPFLELLARKRWPEPVIPFLVDS